jgi:fumarylacetoacetase
MAQSWVKYSPECQFPIENLPYGVFSTGSNAEKRIGVAIGDQVLDLSVLATQYADLIPGDNKTVIVDAFKSSTLNKFMSLGKSVWDNARAILIDLLSVSNTTLSQHKDAVLVSQKDAIMHLPAQIGDYTDFYASRNHAYNVGVLFRGKDNALQPNWTWLPVGYHGRASSVVVSGTDLIRPCGQLTPPDNSPPATLGACKTLDFELELGFFMGTGNELGHPISIDDAKDKIFGVVLLNDWSARDIQKWEYVPLGPFGAKNFGTTISPWIVTYAALEPFFTGPSQPYDPEPLDYLKETKSDKNFLDINLDVYMIPNEEAQNNINGEQNCNKDYRISTSNAKYLYWSPQQMVTHHTVTGCNLQPGDLLGSGTISGPQEHEYGSLLELSWKGSKTIDLAQGKYQRKFIQDGDAINITGTCKGNGYVVGFGDCAGKILPARKL